MYWFLNPGSTLLSQGVATLRIYYQGVTEKLLWLTIGLEVAWKTNVITLRKVKTTNFSQFFNLPVEVFQATYPRRRLYRLYLLLNQIPATTVVTHLRRQWSGRRAPLLRTHTYRKHSPKGCFLFHTPWCSHTAGSRHSGKHLSYYSAHLIVHCTVISTSSTHF